LYGTGTGAYFVGGLGRREIRAGKATKEKRRENLEIQKAGLPGGMLA
jgi:hypothetical protein